jgi:lysophospholipase L1-like esterase
MKQPKKSPFATRAWRCLLGCALAATLTPQSLQAKIDAAVGPPAGAPQRTDQYNAAGYGFYTAPGGTTINRIGYWDQGGDGLAISHDVMIGKSNGTGYDQVLRVTIPAGTAARFESGYRWVNIPDLVLPNIGLGADYYYIVASHGTDPWADNLASAIPMAPEFGTVHDAAVSANNGPMDAASVTIIGQIPGGWGGANFGYEPAVATPPVSDGRVKIMPLGDSITAGFTDNPTWNEPFEFGYRGPLAKLMVNGGVPFHFVGRSAEPFSNTSGDPTHGGTVYPVNELRDPGIDQGNHRGYGGYSITDIDAGVEAWINSDDPDVILLMIGTNGIGSASPGQLNTLVSHIFTVKPAVKLVVAQIIPTVSYNPDVINYNSYIRNTLVPNYLGQGRNISTVDQYKNFLTNPADNTSIDTSKIANGINHPTDAAYQLMAATWLPALTGVTLGSSTVPPDIAAGAVIATLSHPGAAAGESVSYSLVAGDGDSDNAKFTIGATGQLMAGGDTFGQDPAGKVYSIRVQANGSVSGVCVQILRLVRGAAADPLAISVVTAVSSNELAYAGDVKTDDLLQGLAGVHLNYNVIKATPGPQINDGLYGGATDTAAIAWANHGNISSSTYELGTGSGTGYDISRITSIAAWTNAGFMNQKYKVSVRYSGATEYTPVPDCTVDYQPVTDQGASGATKVIVTRPGGMLFHHVEGIRFTFLKTDNSNPAGGVTIREIDVEGAASSVVSAYDTWVAGFAALTGSGKLTTADPDGDGLVNLLEFAFGTDPTTGPAGAVSYSGTTLNAHGAPGLSGQSAVFTRRKDYVAAGLTYTVQFSADLATWVDNTTAPVVVASDSAVEAVTVAFPATIDTPAGAVAPKFFRIQVTGG